MYSCLYEDQKFLDCSMQSETCQLEKTEDNKIFFKLLVTVSKKNIVVYGQPSIKWTSWEGSDMLLKLD